MAETGAAMYLAADIGGTKSLLALYTLDGGRLLPVFKARYPSSRFPGLAELLGVFLDESAEVTNRNPIKAACAALAGTREGEAYTLVNLGWRIEPEALDSLTPVKIPWILRNDMEALAAGIPYVAPDMKRILLAGGEPAAGYGYGSMGLLAPGTGLGKAFVLGGAIHPSEGGHISFAPCDEEEVRLWRFLHGQYGHVSVERILSGPGLACLARFAAIEAGTATDKIPGDPESISRQAREGTCPHCVHAARLFARILAREAGNFALTVLPGDGIYLAGGMTGALMPFLDTGEFREAFLDKGRFKGFLGRIPVTAILDPEAVLLGSGVLASTEALKRV